MRAKGVNFRIKGHDESNQAFNRFNGNLKRTQQQLRAQIPMQRSWNKGLTANRRAVQQFGFQMSDFAIQIAGGQNAMLAFTQQGGQMLQFFGPFGAVMAALLAIFGSLGIALARAGVGLNEILPIAGVLKTEFQTLGTVLVAVKDIMIGFANLVVNNLDQILITASLVAGFFAARWLSAFIAASGAVTFLRGAVLASVISIRTLGVTMGLAQIITMGFVSALVALKTALLRLAIPALVIGLGYLIERFLKLREAAGSFGGAIKLIADVFKAYIQNMSARVAIFINNWAISVAHMKIAFAKAMIPIAQAWDDLIVNMVAKWNSVFGEMAGGSLKLSVGWSAADQLRGAIAGYTDDVGALTKANAELQQGINDNTGAFERFGKALEDTKVDVGEWFGGSKGDKGKGGGGTKKLKSELDELKKTWEGLRDTISGSFSTAFKSILNGTKSVKDAALDMLGTVLSKVVDIMMQPLFTKLATGAANFFGGLLGLPTFDGGGHTGYGPRSGGLDGRGGRMAIVHPNETVEDHTRGTTQMHNRNSGGSGGSSVTIHQNFAVGIADTVKAEMINMLPDFTEAAAAVVREKVQDGGDYGAAF